MRRWTSIVAAALCLPLAGCFEEPVREHLHLTLFGAGPVIVTVVQAVSDPELAQNNAALASPAPEDRQPDPDPVVFTALQRFFASAPTLSEVASALFSELVPVAVSALRWVPPAAPAGDPDAGAEAWLARMAEAEASVPD